MSEHDGHRQRIIAKLDTGGLCDHELLEILLFNGIARCDTNELAHRLLDTFGSMRGVFAATVEQLKAVKGVGGSIAGYLNCIGKILDKYYDTGEGTFPRTFDSESFFQYVEKRFAPMKKEVVEIYLLDADRRITMRKHFTTENAFHVQMKPEELTKLLVDNKPAGLVVAHNHPVGQCFPSEADDRNTGQLQVICSIHSVLFYDHFIYSPVGIYSYYKSGRMREINERYSIGAILSKK